MRHQPTWLMVNASMENSTEQQHKSCEPVLLIQYFRIGLKPVPIGDDGVTPNVSGLLTPDEQLTSITECGKVEPSNLYL